jgi:hypothetical protein
VGSWEELEIGHALVEPRLRLLDELGGGRVPLGQGVEVRHEPLEVRLALPVGVHLVVEEDRLDLAPVTRVLADDVVLHALEDCLPVLGNVQELGQRDVARHVAEPILRRLRVLQVLVRMTLSWFS